MKSTYHGPREGLLYTTCIAGNVTSSHRVEAKVIIAFRMTQQNRWRSDRRKNWQTKKGAVTGFEGCFKGRLKWGFQEGLKGGLRDGLRGGSWEELLGDKDRYKRGLAVGASSLKLHCKPPTSSLSPVFVYFFR